MGWYEWAKRDGQKIPHALARTRLGADGAGQHLGVLAPSDRYRMLTLAIVTTLAAADLVTIHDRMPLVLEEPDWPIGWAKRRFWTAKQINRPRLRSES